jgi:hypothetical protein
MWPGFSVGHNQLTGSYEYGNELQDFVKIREFLDWQCCCCCGL